jgi:hypothetical protein
VAFERWPQRSQRYIKNQLLSRVGRGASGRRASRRGGRALPSGGGAGLRGRLDLGAQLIAVGNKRVRNLFDLVRAHGRVGARLGPVEHRRIFDPRRAGGEQHRGAERRYDNGSAKTRPYSFTATHCFPRFRSDPCPDRPRPSPILVDPNVPRMIKNSIRYDDPLRHRPISHANAVICRNKDCGRHLTAATASALSGPTKDGLRG